MARVEGKKRSTKARATDAHASAAGKFNIVGPKTFEPGVTALSVGKRDAKVIRRSGEGTVIEQRVYGGDGRLKTVYTIDLGSETFGTDLGYAFKKNVAKARRENKKKFGYADAIRQKG